MPFVEVAGSEGTVAPAQITSEVPKLNTGMIFWLTVTVRVVPVAHWPELGVNVYVPDVWLLTVDGLHVPVIPLVDVAGNTGTDVPAQIAIEVPKLNVGVTIGLTVTTKFMVNAHCPTLGVKT